MCSMSEFADVKEDLSCDTGDTGDSDKLDTLSESSSDTLDHKNSDGLSNPVICVDICEQNMCDAGPCKKQRVTTKSAASDLQSIFHSTENNLNNSSVYSGPDWSSDQDNLNNDVCCNRGNTSCRVGKSSSPNCLCMCMENVLNPVVRSNSESFSSSFNHPDDCVENVDDSESKNCLPHFVGNDERQEKRSDELSSFESYIPLSVNHSSSNDLDNIKDEKYFDKQIAGSTCELSSLNKSDRPLEDYNFLNQKENIKADNNLYPTSDVKRPEISSNSVNVEVEEKNI